MEIDNDSTDGDGIDDPMIRAFKIEEILHHIFNFLPLESIKCCRLVCHEWNAIAEKLLLKCSTIMFHNNRQCPEDSRLPDKFIDEFHNSSLYNKINKFCFNSPDSSIDFEDFENFIGNFGDDMKELTIFRTNIRCVLYTLRKKDLINLIPFNLTKLDVVCEGINTEFIVSMDRLINIKTLRLGEGILKIEKNVTIAPVELQLKNVIFLENRNNCLSVKLNNLFDFRNLQILRLDCSDTNNIELDLGGVFNLKSLILDRVKIVNWESSKWIVKRLSLGNKMKFETASGMQFDELDFSGTMVNISVLPKTLKKLEIRELKTKLLNIELAGNLVNLEYLILHRREFSLLKNFSHCTKLTHLHLIPTASNDDDLVAIDVSLFPKSLKVFRLSYDCELSGTGDFNLETLMIENVDFWEAFHMASAHFKAQNVFLYCFDFAYDAEEFEMEEFMAFQNLIVGPLLPSERDKFRFYFEENPKADYLMKNSNDAVLNKKEVGKIEIEQIKNYWWTKNL